MSFIFALWLLLSFLNGAFLFCAHMQSVLSVPVVLPCILEHAQVINFWSFLQLLGRVFNVLRENNPELAGDRRRTVMRPPQVMREGTKKTVFANFTDLCKM